MTTNEGLLAGKVAVVYGGGGALGGACAQAFAREGCRVHLAGRSLARPARVASEIRRAGGSCEVAQVDALDPAAVEAHLESIGAVDICLNAVGFAHVQGVPFTELGLEDFSHPIAAYTRTHFITAQAAAGRMKAGGVLLSISTPGSRLPGPGFMGYGVACAAIEAITRQLVGELGPRGIRSICLRSDAIPEAIGRGSHSGKVFATAAAALGTTVEAMLAQAAKAGPMGRLPTLDEVADTAAFVASDRASGITGAILNLTCGSLVD